MPDMPVGSAYDAWAPHYDHDSNATRDLDAVVLRRLLPDLGGLRVLEAGCGTGKNTEALLAAPRVVALDLSRGMLAQARARLGTRPGLHLVQHDMRFGMPFRAGSFDLVTFDLVLEHLEDLTGPLREARRVLRPGGTCLIVEFHPYRQLEGARARFEGAAGAAVTPPAFVHMVQDWLDAAEAAELRLQRLQEWSDRDLAADRCREPGRHPRPRLLSLVLRR